MRVLFVHPVFPGPFAAQVNGLVAMPEAEVTFMTEPHGSAPFGESESHRVRRLIMPSPGKVNSGSPVERELLGVLRRSANTASALLRLRQEGYSPDLVCLSASSGCGLHVADIFPNARRVVHGDWFHSLGALSERPPREAEPWRVRNMWRFGVLTDAHCVFTSTEWQKVQFPLSIAERISVLPQGIDTALFAPPARSIPLNMLLPELKGVHELVTVSSRSLQPGVGLPSLVMGLLRVLSERPQCHLLVMDTERGNSMSIAGPVDPTGIIGPVLPDMETLHGVLEPLLSTAGLAERVHIVGTLPLTEYRRLLCASSVHVFLTAPLALSPELIEAMSCGCVVLASDTEPVREVIRHGENGFLCPVVQNGEGMAESAIVLLARTVRCEETLVGLRQAARNTVLAHFDRSRQMDRHVQMLQRV